MMQTRVRPSLEISVRTILLFAMAIGLLFPSGIGIDVGLILNSSKVSVLLILCLVLSLIFNRNQTVFSPVYIDWLILSFIAWLFVGAVLSGVLNTGSFIGLFKLFISTLSWVLAYCSFYFIGRFLPRNEVDIQWILKGLLYILFICALIGIVEFIFQTNIYGELGRLLGLHDAGSGTELWRGQFYRARSSLDQPIAFGFGMASGYVLTNYLIKIKCLTWGVLFLFVFIAAVVVSGSRSAIASIFVCAVIINYRSFGSWAKWSLALVVIVSLYWVGSHLDSFFFVDESFLAGEESAVGQSGNLIGRVRDFEFVQNVLETTPLFGVGTGMLHNEKVFTNYYPSLSNDYDGALDNMVLAILVENGVIGLLMAAISILGIIGYSYRLSECPEKHFLMLLVFIFFAGSISYDILVFPGTARLILLLIALGISTLQIRQLRGDCFDLPYLR